MPRNSLLLLGFLSLASVASAQHGYVINSVDIPSTHGFSNISAGNAFLSFVNATVANGFVDADHTGSYELMAGAKGSGVVVDIICVNSDVFVFGCTYTFPANLPGGSYHYRVNITNDNNNSALSETFQVTPTTFDCLTPPPKTYNVTSTADPNFRSLVYVGPQAGYVVHIDAMLWINWGYVDSRNDKNVNITNLQFEMVSDKTGQPAGLHVATSDDLFTEQVAYHFEGIGLSPGAWRVRANYSSPFENGGKTVSVLSEVMYIEGADYTHSCDGLGKGKPSSSGGDLGRFGGVVKAWKQPLFLSILTLLVWLY